MIIIMINIVTYLKRYGQTEVQHMVLVQGLLQWLLEGPHQMLSRPQLKRYLLDICHWEVYYPSPTIFIPKVCTCYLH